MPDEETIKRQTLSVGDAMALVVGIVVGVGIFRTPSLVAANAGSATAFLLIWLLGGVVSLVGALCYAELATTYPHAGGDYHYLTRAFGRNVAFLFGWARMTVIQTGSVAMLAFIFGDYMEQLFSPGAGASSIYAGAAIVLLTAINILGIKQTRWTQNLLTAAKILGLLLIIVPGLVLSRSVLSTGSGLPAGPPITGAAGLAMIFALLTYGGWNEAAYISAEVKRVERTMVWTLLGSIGIITAVYLLANLAYLRVMGLEAMSRSDAVATDFMRTMFGEGGARATSLLIAISAIGATNASIFTGARSNFALGRDFSLFKQLAYWQEAGSTPRNALLAQCIISLALVLLGTLARRGFVTMVEYTAPVFWCFFFLAGLSLIVLRIREPAAARPFRVPLYPITPLLFCGTCLYMLRSSIAYTGVGALVGVAVLVAGTPILLIARRKNSRGV